MSSFHYAFAWFVVVANALVGVWALAAVRFSRIRQPALWYSIAVAQVAVVIQALSGIYLFAVAGREIAGFHVFYGVIALVAVALGYVYLKGSEWVGEHRELFYGVLSLFLMGIGIRAMLLAGAI